jgi:hypothetical protein
VVASFVGGAGGSFFQSSGSDQKTAEVTMINGKLTITVPEIWATDWSDSIKISGFVKE